MITLRPVGRSKRYIRNLGRAPREVVPHRGRGHEFVRFEHATEAFGVFSYLRDARHRLTPADQLEVDALREWFQLRLRTPESLIPFHMRDRTTGDAQTDIELEVGRCWFRTSAREHVTNARRLAILVRRAGYPIVERRSDAVPGQICSEDEYQLALASFWVT